MKKLLFIAACLLFIVGSIYFFSKESSARKAVDVPGNAAERRTSGTGSADTAEGKLPKRLFIPKLGVSADVEYVGMDEKGRMDVPKNDDNVAWYEPGYKPGIKGNAVMAGHLDRSTGAPAVFYRLDTLEKGDIIRVEEADGSELEFSVTKKAVYPDASFPLVEVFGPAPDERLNLITCEGSFNRTSRNYSHRTVIYAELTK
jgi:sortase A